MVDLRLEHALRSRLRTRDVEIEKELFRASGALGSFSSKIYFAYLSGILSEDAYKDLKNINKIRNAFAHEYDIDSFEAEMVAARCRNLILIKRHVGPPVEVPSNTDEAAELAKQDWPTPYFGIANYEELLLDARYRYIMTAQIISSALGFGAANPSAALPVI